MTVSQREELFFFIEALDQNIFMDPEINLFLLFIYFFRASGCFFLSIL